jgi:hypothetical protein
MEEEKEMAWPIFRSRCCAQHDIENREGEQLMVEHGERGGEVIGQFSSRSWGFDLFYFVRHYQCISNPSTNENPI